MLAERVQEWTKPWREEGRMEGRMEGRQELLFIAIQARFTPLPPWVETKVKSASLDELSLWTSRFFSASSIEELFSNDAMP